ncbi:MAG: hypothetical protein JJ992_03410, partial [Planctomycetes bacterium]|nr:hypothetical protein [Planctomycetota bacterium]
LPTPNVVSISVWYYRLLMLFWALWLAVSLLRWLTRGWKQFTKGGAWRRSTKLVPSAPANPANPANPVNPANPA